MCAQAERWCKRWRRGGDGDLPEYKPWHDKGSHKTFLKPDTGTWLHYDVYFIDPATFLLGWCGAVASQYLLLRFAVRGCRRRVS